MGDPRRLKKKWKSPRKRWDAERIVLERELVKTYGLRRKKEIRRAEEIIRKFRRRARELIARPNKEEEEMLIKKVKSFGLLKIEDPTIDDILGIQVQDLLERRLQTLVYRKGLANTIKQARQFIAHGHIAVNGRKVVSPGYIVKVGEENSIDFYQNSPLKEMYEKGFGVFSPERKEKARAAEIAEVEEGR